MKRNPETFLSRIEHFYCNLNLESISNSGYEHAKNVSNLFNMKTFCDNHDLYENVKCNTFLFENFREKFFKTYYIDLVCFYSAPELASAALKITKIELEMLINNDMMLMVDKEIMGL